jgi:hypothetical protein
VGERGEYRMVGGLSERVRVRGQAIRLKNGK